MNLRSGLYSFLLGVASSHVLTESEIEAKCRCTCMMRPTLPEVVCEDERLSTLCTAVSSLPELASKLAREDLVYSVFAPSDDAFAALPEAEASKLLANAGLLENLILLHTIVGFTPVCAEDLICANIMFMANGQNTKTACSFDDGPPQGDDAKPEDGEEPTAYYQKGRGNGRSKGNMPKVIAPDVRAKNGVIHIVDNVILQKDSFCTYGPDCGSCKGECETYNGCGSETVEKCISWCEEYGPCAQ